MSQTGSRITVIFPLYHAADKIPALLKSLRGQKHPRHPDPSAQGEWLEVIFIDNASADATVAVLNQELEKIGRPSYIRVVQNPENIGLSRSLNKAFSLTTTPYALTCHSDCRFGQDDYVARMLELMEANPKVAAITGRPAVEPGKPIPIAEKVNLVANLMDLFPPQTGAELIPVGFAEGRCDVFRVSVLKQVGYYDTTLRLAGEDQILAGQMRALGLEVCQAPQLTYYLSVSVQQDSLAKLPKHQRRFGRAHPYILMASREAKQGVTGKQAGLNRKLRTFLRAQQMAATGGYLAVIALLLIGAPWVYPLGLLALIFLVKVALFSRHFREIPFTGREYLTFFAWQPIFDGNYTWGLAEGLLALLKKPENRDIS